LAKKKKPKKQSGTRPAWRGLVPVEKGHGRVNIVQILCIHICNGKIPVETVPRIWGGWE
jgi:hypothetical protein